MLFFAVWLSLAVWAVFTTMTGMNDKVQATAWLAVLIDTVAMILRLTGKEQRK